MNHYDKYLKYKDKYINLKNQIGGLSKTFYDLTGKTLYCFSDIEGSNPFKMCNNEL